MGGGRCYLLEHGELNGNYTWELNRVYAIEKSDSQKTLTASGSSERGGVSWAHPLSWMEC